MPSAIGLRAIPVQRTAYQGWFTCEGDGAGLGWTHWAKNRKRPLGPGSIAVDLWPDVSEYDDDELHATAFTHDDGSPARTFSSPNRKTVVRHFEWMRDHGTGGAVIAGPGASPRDGRQCTRHSGPERGWHQEGVRVTD